MTSRSALLALLLLGCNSPPPASEDPFAAPTAKPGEAAPAQTAATTTSSGSGEITMAAGVDKKDQVLVKGEVIIDKFQGKSIQMDFIRSGGASPPLVVHRLTAPGPFEVMLPKGSGAVDVILYIDRTGDGPGPGDLRQAWSKNPFTVGEAPVEGLSITLVDSGLATDAPPGAAQNSVAAPNPATTAGASEAAATSAPTAAPTQAPASATTGAAAGAAGAAGATTP